MIITTNAFLIICGCRARVLGRPGRDSVLSLDHSRDLPTLSVDSSSAVGTILVLRSFSPGRSRPGLQGSHEGLIEQTNSTAQDKNAASSGEHRARWEHGKSDVSLWCTPGRPFRGPGAKSRERRRFANDVVPQVMTRA